jgi:hypothetical protein
MTPIVCSRVYLFWSSGNGLDSFDEVAEGGGDEAVLFAANDGEGASDSFDPTDLRILSSMSPIMTKEGSTMYWMKPWTEKNIDDTEVDRSWDYTDLTFSYDCIFSIAQRGTRETEFFLFVSLSEKFFHQRLCPWLMNMPWFARMADISTM